MNPTNRILWSIVRGPIEPHDKKIDHYRRNIKMVELGMYEGHERILIEQKPIADYCAYFIRACVYTHYYAMNYGVATMLFAWRYPTKPWLWLTLCYISFVNAYCHSRFLRCDRFHRYQMLFPEEWYDLCVVSDFGLEDFPDDYQPYHIPGAVWLLRRINRLRSMVAYVKHQTVACTAAFFVSFRMWQWEEEIVGFTSSRSITHWPVINRCDYFLPNFLNMDNQWMNYIPKDMVTFLGMTLDVWAFLILFGFRAYDLVTAKMPQNRTPSQRDLNKWRRPLKGL